MPRQSDHLGDDRKRKFLAQHHGEGFKEQREA